MRTIRVRKPSPLARVIGQRNREDAAREALRHTTAYGCPECGSEHDDIERARACIQSHRKRATP